MGNGQSRLNNENVQPSSQNVLNVQSIHYQKQSKTLPFALKEKTNTNSTKINNSPNLNTCPPKRQQISNASKIISSSSQISDVPEQPIRDLPTTNLQNMEQINGYDQSRIVNKRTRNISMQSAGPSGFSQVDGGYFSLISDSMITDITSDSHFSVNSFMKTPGKLDFNDYIISIHDSYGSPIRTANSTPLSVVEDDMNFNYKSILEFLMETPKKSFDIFTDILGSGKIKYDDDRKQQVYKAAEEWSIKANDASAKVTLAKCKLCGWGTSINPEQGFSELRSLAEQGTWEAYLYLGQCYYFGVNQSKNLGYTLSGKHESNLFQSIDKQKAVFWFEKVLNAPSDIETKYMDEMVAYAKLCIAVIRFNLNAFEASSERNIDMLKQSAAYGNRIAEFLLAFMIQKGLTTGDLSAKEYYTRSAKQSYTPAQIQLGMILLLEENSDEGVTWLEKAAHLGDSRASYQLGLLYELGMGVNKDYTVAISNYNRAIELGDSMAKFRMGYNYLHGQIDLPQDIAKAYKLIYESAKSGYAEAEFTLGLMYRDNKLPDQVYIRQNFQPHHYDKKRNGQEALIWFRRAADKQLPNAVTQIARCYEDGVGTSVNHTIATEYFERALKIPGKHLGSAQMSYAQFLQRNGNDEKAFEMYFKAAGLNKTDGGFMYSSSPIIIRTAKRTIAIYYLNNGNPHIPYRPKDGFNILKELVNLPNSDAESHYWFAACFEEGVPHVCEVDSGKAYSHYFISAKMGYSKAQFQVGVMLCKGSGVQKNHVEALNWFLSSSKQNNVDAHHQVAVYYYNGSQGIPRNPDKAREYFKKAANLGKRDSMAGYAQTSQDKIKLIKQNASNSSLPLTPEQASEVEKLQNEYIRYYKDAAKLNHPASLREVGKLYEAGLGVKQDYSLANEYFQRASDLKDSLATLLLGNNYENGLGVPVDLEKAMAYYQKALKYGQSNALYAIAKLYEKCGSFQEAYEYYLRVSKDTSIAKYRNSTKTAHFKITLYSLNYTPTLKSQPNGDIAPVMLNCPLPEVMPAQKAFQILYHFAVYDNFQESYIWLAQCYLSGNGVTENIPEAIRWLNKAANEAQDSNAMRKLAFMYEQGMHVAQDSATAQKYRTKLNDRI
ncbi:HCP-like protein [Backusella circina FSU 941]|nr:HCP-like protein [Backusella circina FSU 941]